MTAWGVACCPTCGEPLISTFEVAYKEFLCMVCGRRWEFLQPTGKPETPALMARHDELREQFDSGVRP